MEGTVDYVLLVLYPIAMVSLTHIIYVGGKYSNDIIIISSCNNHSKMVYKTR